MCKVVCRITLDAKSAKEFKAKIDDEYRVNMYGILFFIINTFSLLSVGSAFKLHSFKCICRDRILDNLPLVVPIQRREPESTTVYQLGFHVGLKAHIPGVGTFIFGIYFCSLHGCAISFAFSHFKWLCTEQG